MTDNEFQEVSYKKQRELTFAEKAKFIKLNIKKGDTIIKNNWIILHDLNGQIKYKPVNLGEKGFWNTNINNAYKYFTDEEIKIKTKEDFINSEKDKNINNIGKYYCRSLRLIDGTSKHITDKLPLNFQLVSLIFSCMPNAKIIHCTRDARDNCLSIYKNYFWQEVMPWSYNQIELNLYYNLYTL